MPRKDRFNQTGPAATAQCPVLTPALKGTGGSARSVKLGGTTICLDTAVCAPAGGRAIARMAGTIGLLLLIAMPRILMPGRDAGPLRVPRQVRVRDRGQGITMATVSCTPSCWIDRPLQRVETGNHVDQHGPDDLTPFCGKPDENAQAVSRIRMSFDQPAALQPIYPPKRCRTPDSCGPGQRAHAPRLLAKLRDQELDQAGWQEAWRQSTRSRRRKCSR